MSRSIGGNSFTSLLIGHFLTAESQLTADDVHSLEKQVVCGEVEDVAVEAEAR